MTRPTTIDVSSEAYAKEMARDAYFWTYWPKPAATDGSWTPTPVTPVQ